jgi:hypothetical protein
MVLPDVELELLLEEDEESAEPELDEPEPDEPESDEPEPDEPESDEPEPASLVLPALNESDVVVLVEVSSPASSSTCFFLMH